MDVNVSLMREIVIQVNNGIAINVDVNVKRKDCAWNPGTCNCKNGIFSKYYR